MIHRVTQIPRQLRIWSFQRLAILGSALVPGIAAAGDDAYHLLNPTPRDQMRELSTDRPDTTESPYTVDAGHFQIETTLLGWHRDTDSSLEAQEISVFEANAKVGLTTWSDLQLVAATYKSVSVSDGTTDTDLSGIGDLMMRVKLNLWGNDSGTTAFALMPFVTFPTAGDGLGVEGVEAGLIIPLGIAAPADFDVGLMVEIDAVHDDAGDLAPAILLTATTSHELSGPMGGFVECTSLHEQGSWEHEAHVGITVGVGDDWQFDTGATTDTGFDSLGAFVGVSARR